jgi:hypothetical protein
MYLHNRLNLYYIYKFALFLTDYTIFGKFIKLHKARV